jgi:hypothetical protein
MHLAASSPVDIAFFFFAPSDSISVAGIWPSFCVPRRCSASRPPFLVRVVIFSPSDRFFMPGSCCCAVKLPRRCGALRPPFLIHIVIFFPSDRFSTPGSCCCAPHESSVSFHACCGALLLALSIGFSGFFCPLLSPSVPLHGAAFLEGPSSAAPDLLRRRRPRGWSTILFRFFFHRAALMCLLLQLFSTSFSCSFLSLSPHSASSRYSGFRQRNHRGACGADEEAVDLQPLA